MIIVKTIQQQNLLNKYGYNPKKRFQLLRIKEKSYIFVYTKKNVDDDPLIIKAKFKRSENENP